MIDSFKYVLINDADRDAPNEEQEMGLIWIWLILFDFMIICYRDIEWYGI